MTSYAIYGLRLKSDRSVRYVGLSADPKSRLSQHFSSARPSKSMLPVHCWIRKHGKEAVEMIILETCDDWDYLVFAEKYWISSMLSYGKNLLNLTSGGEGVLGLPAWNKGIPMTEDQKDVLRQINIGKIHSEETKAAIKIGVSKHFEVNGHKPVYDFWVDKYGEDEAAIRREAKRLKASATLSGEGNPMYGRSGQDAPCYGRVGDKHPMFGTHHSEEVRARISATTKGRPKSELTKIRMSFANHKRFHESKIKTTCKWCLGADLQNELKKRETELNGNEVE
jgi:predicted GIY-YIG superfamily endonuclease